MDNNHALHVIFIVADAKQIVVEHAENIYTSDTVILAYLDSKLFLFIPQPLPFATTFFDHPIETTRTTTTTMKKKKKLDPKWELSILNFQNLFCPFFFFCR